MDWVHCLPQAIGAGVDVSAQNVLTRNLKFRDYTTYHMPGDSVSMGFGGLWVGL